MSASPPGSRRPPQRAALSSLRLSAYRNHPERSLEPGPASVILTGPNGAGKTNVLEAASLLVPGRGLRHAELSDLATQDLARPWAVAAELDLGGPARVRIGTGADPAGAAQGRRLVRIDGRSQPQTALSGLMTQVWLTPQEHGLFLEPAATRRRWLDRIVFGFDPAHAGRVSRYQRLLRERTLVLRDPRPDRIWLETLEQGLAETGAAVIAARADIARRLTQAAAAQPGPFPAARVEVLGEAEAIMVGRSALAAEDAWTARLADDRQGDADHGGAGLGPHRSEVAVSDAARNRPAAQCSTGEQKALLLALVLANARLLAAETGRLPVLLLDDVAALLDEPRRRALFALLAEIGAQVWMTGTEPALFRGWDGPTLAVTLPD